MGRMWASAPLLPAIGVVGLAAACRGEPSSSSPPASSHAPAAAPVASATAAAAAASAGSAQGLATLVLPFGYGGRSFAPKQIATQPDTKWPADAAVVLDDTFVLELGMGDGLGGLNVITVARSKLARYVWQTREGGEQVWRTVEFTVTDADLADLVKILNESSTLTQPARIEATDINDGAQWILFLRTGGRDKYVYLSNAFPEPLRRVAEFVTGRIVNARPELAAQGRVLSIGGSHDDHLWEDASAYRGEPRDWPPGVWGKFVVDPPLPLDARVTARLVDRTRSAVLARDAYAIESSNRSLCRVPYDAARLDPSHDVVLEVDVVTPTKQRLASAPIAVLTKGHPHAVDVFLKPR